MYLWTFVLRAKASRTRSPRPRCSPTAAETEGNKAIAVPPCVRDKVHVLPRVGDRPGLVRYVKIDKSFFFPSYYSVLIVQVRYGTRSVCVRWCIM